MKKQYVILLILFLLIGCTNTKLPVPTSSAQNDFPVLSDYVIERTEYCHQSYCSEISGDFVSFFNDMEVVKTKETSGSLIFTTTFYYREYNENYTDFKENSHSFILYDNNVISANNQLYKIENIEELKESYAYIFDFINQKILKIQNYIPEEVVLLHLQKVYMGEHGLQITIKNEQMKKDFIQQVSQIVYLESGWPSFGAGGYSFRAEFIAEGKTILLESDDSNSLSLIVDGEYLTNKQSMTLGPSIISISEAMIPVDEYLSLIEFQSSQLFIYEDKNILIEGNPENYNEPGLITQADLNSIDLSSLAEGYEIIYNNKTISELPFEIGEEYAINFVKKDSEIKLIYFFKYKVIEE